MLYLLNWRLWALIFVLALFPAGYLKGRHDGKQIVLAEVAAAKAQANDDARALEQRRQDRADEAAKLAAVREAGIRAAAAVARRESDGLRDDLNAAKQYAKESRAAAERVADTATELLGSCTREYLSVAEQADRSDNEARELRQAWPK